MQGDTRHWKYYGGGELVALEFVQQSGGLVPTAKCLQSKEPVNKI